MSPSGLAFSPGGCLQNQTGVGGSPLASVGPAVCTGRGVTRLISRTFTELTGGHSLACPLLIRGQQPVVLGQSLQRMIALLSGVSQEADRSVSDAKAWFLPPGILWK